MTLVRDDSSCDSLCVTMALEYICRASLCVTIVRDVCSCDWLCVILVVNTYFVTRCVRNKFVTTCLVTRCHSYMNVNRTFISLMNQNIHYKNICECTNIKNTRIFVYVYVCDHVHICIHICIYICIYKLSFINT